MKKGLHAHVDVLMKPYTFGKEDPLMLDPSLSDSDYTDISDEEEDIEVQIKRLNDRANALSVTPVPIKMKEKEDKKNEKNPPRS